MHKFSLLLLAFLISFLADYAAAEPYYHIHTNETGFKRGELIGKTMSREIDVRLQTWNALLSEHFGKTGKGLLEHLNAQERWIDPINRVYPIALEEIRGIAYAVGVSFEELLTYNLAEEIMTFANQQYQACTNIARYTETSVSMAYNLDIPAFLHGNKKPFVISNSKGTVLLGFPGLLATTVITPQFTVTTNSLPDLQSKHTGLPLPVALHMISTQQSALSVAVFLRDTQLSVAQNFMMIDAAHIDNIESSANQVNVHQVSSEHFFHTNFAQFNEDRLVDKSKPLQCARYQTLQDYFEPASKGLKQVIELDKAIALTVDEETFFTVIVTYQDGFDSPSVTLRLPESNQVHSLMTGTDVYKNN